jgi:hypothetical protein
MSCFTYNAGRIVPIDPPDDLRDLLCEELESHMTSAELKEIRENIMLEDEPYGRC